jgi:hypothetical protein
MPTVYFNQYPQQSSGEQTYVPPTMFYPQQISPRLMNEPSMLNDGSSNKSVFYWEIMNQSKFYYFRFLPGQAPFVVMVSLL